MSVGISLTSFGIDLEPGKVDRGHLVLLGQHLRQFEFLDEAELDEVVAYARAVLPLFLQRLVQLGFADEPPRERGGHQCVRALRERGKPNETGSGGVGAWGKLAPREQGVKDRRTPT